MRKNLRKNEGKYRKMSENWGNILILPTREWEAGYGPVQNGGYRSMHMGLCHAKQQVNIIMTYASSKNEKTLNIIIKLNGTLIQNIYRQAIRYYITSWSTLTNEKFLCKTLRTKLPENNANIWEKMQKMWQNTGCQKSHDPFLKRHISKNVFSTVKLIAYLEGRLVELLWYDIVPNM